MSAEEFLSAGRFAGTVEPFSEPISSFARLLDSSTVGVALYDRRLKCKAVNAALTKMSSALASSYAGKTIHEIFREDILKLAAVFRRVWESGNSFSNFPLTVQQSPGMESARWLVSLFRIKDESGQVRLIAATFSEVTKRKGVELHLSGNKFRPHVSRQSNLFGKELTYLSMRNFDLVQLPVEPLKCSMSFRRLVPETRIRKRLVREAAFLNGTRARRSIVRPALPRSRSEPVLSLPPAIANETELSAGCPSPRELQVLHLLADGKSNKEIGMLLEISTRTVEFYRARIMLKLDLHSTAALVRYAIRNNIVEA